MSLGKSSSSSLAKQIFSHCQDDNTPCEEQSGSRSRSTIRGASVASQFKTSLQTLVTGLESTEPHYIRCIKPNLKKASDRFETGEVLRQLRYAGMMEAIRIRREGYAHRESHESFINKYHILLDSEDLKGGEGIEHLVKVLSKRLSVTDVDWQVGHSKIFFRRELAVKLEALASIRIRRAARTIGRFGRIVAHTRAGKLLSAWGRWRLIMIQKHREINAATKIQSAFRMTREVRSFKFARSAVIKMQSVIRMMSGKILLEQLKHPYKDMTFEEVEELYNAEKECLEYAIADKDFELAAELEKKINPLKEALEDKRPLTRALIDKMIKEVEEELEAAVANKDYASCPPLQAKLEDLNKKKEDYPTLEELKQKVVDAQKAVDDAAAKRNFKDAAALQAAVDSAQQRLQKALSLERESIEDVQELEQESKSDESNKLFSSRSELEEAIKTKKDQIDEAIKQKNFSDASSIQDELDQLESLRSHYPTIAELEAALKSKEKDMTALISNKKFAEASALQEEIDALSEKIKAETATESTQESENVSVMINDGLILTFSSRSDLESSIQEYESKVETAAATKNFTEATASQEIVTKLESLRQYLPTLDDLCRQEKELEVKMDQALKSKDFALAESLDKELSKLKETLKNEKQRHQTLFSSQTPSSPTEKKEDEIKPKYSLKTSKTKVQTQSKQSSTKNTNKNGPITKAKQTNISRTVSKLRPKKPLISSISDSVLSVAQMLANKRGSASLVIGVDGGLAGIITDTDVTRRLVAKDLDASVTNVSKVMTANPTVVSVNDPAMDALSTMVENHFRHLPVVDDNGAVVGVLDIAKCLNDAISKLEKAEEQNSSAAADAVKQMAALQGAGGQQAAMLTQLLGPLMSQAFGGKASPTLRSLLAGKPATIVSPSASLKKTSIAMAEAKKAALVVDKGELVGIFGFKDMMSRAVAKELPLEHTAVESVMTPNPESVSPDMTVIEALQVMHDNKFLNLPVCESDGRVCGLVGVMDLIYGCGGAEGWRSLFDRTMSMGGEDGSETASRVSSVRSSSVKSFRTSKSSNIKKNLKPVSKLRPRKALILSESCSVTEICQHLAAKRSASVLLTDTIGKLSGIITDHDIVRRVVARHKNASDTVVSTVMTKDPTAVSSDDPADEALHTMIENHYRYLPVIDNGATISGILDIGKCLNDAITKLEKSVQNKSSSNSHLDKLMASAGGDQNQAKILAQLLGPIMEQAFKNQDKKTLGDLLAGKPSSGFYVTPSSSLVVTGMMMADNHKAALVVEDGELVGIVSFKDIVTRALAKDLDLESTEVQFWFFQGDS